MNTINNYELIKLSLLISLHKLKIYSFLCKMILLIISELFDN